MFQEADKDSSGTVSGKRVVARCARCACMPVHVSECVCVVVAVGRHASALLGGLHCAQPAMWLAAQGSLQTAAPAQSAAATAQHAPPANSTPAAQLPAPRQALISCCRAPPLLASACRACFMP